MVPKVVIKVAEEDEVSSLLRLAYQPEFVCKTNDQCLARYNQTVLYGSKREPQSEPRKLYHYDGEDTCANNGLCQIKCPINIDTGKMIKQLRFEKHFSLENTITYWYERNFELASKLARLGAALNLSRKLLGSDALVGLSRMIRKASGNQIPQWNPHFPKPAPWDQLAI